LYNNQLLKIVFMKIETNKQPSFQLSIKKNIIKEFGYDLSLESVILDFGCGNGKLVEEFCDLGYKAFGCCTRFSTEVDVDTDAMIRKGIIRTIDLKNYVLPFEDNTFDFIFSQSVFEHVQNYSESISEIARVLKPDGFCLHSFASRYRPIEPHVYVPLSSVIQSQLWLYFWAILGIRNNFSANLNAKETSIKFYNYLKDETNYLSKKQLINQFGIKFQDVIFCENLFNKHSPVRGKYLYALSKILPFIPSIYSALFSRVIFTRLPKKAQSSTMVHVDS